MQETVKFTSIKKLVGIDSEEVKVGQASKFDYDTVAGKRKQKMKRPPREHILLGVPDIDMKTCSRVMTKNGPVFRGGGLYLIGEQSVQLGKLKEIYKDSIGVCHAVIEKLTDVTHAKQDPFLQEAKIKVWKRSGHFLVTSDLFKIQSSPLLHACSLEDIVTGRLLTGLVQVREERQTVEQRRTEYKCLGADGRYFLVSVTCLSLPSNIGVACC